jgi:hypothetical protein
MGGEVRRTALVTLLVVCSTTALLAQSSRWADPYREGLKALDARSYEQAASLFQRAIAADPRAAANKYVEGVFSMDYFPYFYLAIAQLELRQYDQASANFTKARATRMNRALTTRLDDYEKRLASEATVARGGPPQPPPQPAQPPPPQPRPNAPNPNFAPALRAAEAAMEGQRYADAIRAFDAAKAADAAEFARVDGQARRDAAGRAVAALQKADEARQLLGRSQLTAARAAFAQAEQMFPGTRAVSDGLTEIAQREEAYRRAKASLEQAVRAANVAGAQAALTQARVAWPEQATADRLEAIVYSMSQPPAPKPPQASTGGGGLSPRDAGTHVAPPPAPPQATIVQPGPAGRGGASAVFSDALTALYRGDTTRAIELLEPAAATEARSSSTAGLHAYLGVAYATKAFASTGAAETSKTLREQAIVEFRRALAAQRDYRLSPRLVSPRIIELFEQARTN